MYPAIVCLMLGLLFCFSIGVQLNLFLFPTAFPCLTHFNLSIGSNKFCIMPLILAEVGLLWMRSEYRWMAAFVFMDASALLLRLYLPAYHLKQKAFEDALFPQDSPLHALMVWALFFVSTLLQIVFCGILMNVSGWLLCVLLLTAIFLTRLTFRHGNESTTRKGLQSQFNHNPVPTKIRNEQHYR